MINPATYIVPDRDCGTCTACCVELAITTEGLEKHAGVACRHCTGAGCAIYESRPQFCRDYHCVWRSMPALADGWRPDLSGVMIVWGTVPEGFAGEHAVDVILLGPAETLTTDAFVTMVGGLIAQGVATFLDLPRGPGFLSTNALLNDLLEPAIAARDRALARTLLASAYAHMMERPARLAGPDQAPANSPARPGA